MKIRNGFVSNSSSSSFIIEKGGKYTDTISIALSMVKDMIKEYEINYKAHPRKDIIYDNLKYLKEKYTDVPIMFNSTNYDTYIVDIGHGYVYIDTCNNIQWSIERLSLDHLPQDIIDDYGKSIDFSSRHEVTLHDQVYQDWDDVTDQQIEPSEKVVNIKYYKIDSGFFIQKTKSYESCKKCYRELFVIGGEELCIYCDENYIQRRFKLGKIKKALNKKKL